MPMNVRKFEADCAGCSARRVCLSRGVASADLQRVQSIVYLRRTVRRSEPLFAAGDECDAVYAVKQGYFKTSLVSSDGRAQVTGFFLAGDLLGMDGVAGGRHSDTAIALEESQVCVMPYVLIEPMAREVPALQHGLHASLSGQIEHNHRAMMMLGSMSAEERVATFLVNLSRRLLRSGLSGRDLQLRMTRGDIGSYLGLSLETVSRLLSIFQRNGLVQVQQKHLRILDIGALEKTSHGSICCSRPARLPASRAMRGAAAQAMIGAS